jgi:DNA-binding NtrC family response regulator
MALLSNQSPAQIDRILVVAPTDALRASLRFLLEEESYQVATVASIDEAVELRDVFACTVVDHHALKSRRADETAAFMAANWPVVLLANGTPGVELPDSYRVVTKPLLGAALSHAVREAVMLHGTTSETSPVLPTFK